MCTHTQTCDIYGTTLLYLLAFNYNNITLAVVYGTTFKILINFSFVSWAVILSDRILLLLSGSRSQCSIFHMHFGLRNLEIQRPTLTSSYLWSIKDG